METTNNAYYGQAATGHIRQRIRARGAQIGEKMKKPVTALALPSSYEDLKKKLKRTVAHLLSWFYHTIVLLTPLKYKWQYRFDNREELEYVKLRDEDGVCLGKFDVISRQLIVTGDYGSARFWVDEEISLTKIQWKMLSWLDHDADTKIGLGKGFYLLSFNRIFDEIEEAKLLTYEYKWHTRDNFSWLVKGGDTIICEVNSNLAKYRFKDGDWQHVPHADEETFRAYIENREKHGSRKA